MRVVICGDRKWTDYGVVFNAMLTLPAGTVVISGAAKGADEAGEKAAAALGLAVERYPAHWEAHGRFAGPLRNLRMLHSGVDRVFAFHDYISKSKGTGHMIRVARERGIPVTLFSHLEPNGRLL